MEYNGKGIGTIGLAVTVVGVAIAACIIGIFMWAN